MSNEHRQSASSNNKAPIKLVTVHGTGAGDITSSGDKWWQFGSVFIEDLQSRLALDDSELELVPFQWQDGPNSEDKRREAGFALAKQLRSYDAAKQDYYIIGHSHGGSVIYNALLKSIADNTPFEGLRSWCTVGTPFLDYRPNRFLFQRLRSLGLTICTSAIVAFTLGLCITIAAFVRSSINHNVEMMGHAMMLYGVINYTLLWLYEFRSKSWFTLKQKKAVEKYYSKLWCGLWHKEDEAISALSNIQHLNAPIIPKTFLLPVVASLQFAVVILIGAYLAIDLAFYDGSYLIKLAEFFRSDYEESGFGFLTWMILFSFFVFCVPSFWLLTKALNVFARIIGVPLAKIGNSIVWTSIKHKAWGDDMLKEDVHAISSHPPQFDYQCDCLPETIAAPLRQHSEKNAIKTLQKVRVVLGMAEESGAQVDLRSELSESLNWQELIHTSYFDVPEFIDLLVKSLQEAGLTKNPKAL